ncbi:MAG: ATP-binding SpoIIE family protein phosphatase, partial [Vulcanimicrobiaceae bacterium]
YELRVRPIYLENQTIVKWIGTLTDVEEARRAASELAVLKHHFEVLAEAGGVFGTAQTIYEIAAGLIRLSNLKRAERWFAALRDLRGAIVRCNLEECEHDTVQAAIGQKREAIAFVNAGEASTPTSFVVAPVVPLQSDEVYGYVGFSRDGDDVAEDDRTLVTELAARAAIAVGRILTNRRDQELAQMLQRSMLPLALPYLPGIRLDVAYEPAEREALVGGDWYDAFELPDGLIAVAIGDVAGHGFGAAVVMNQTRQTIRAAAFDNPDPASALARANRIINAQMQPMVTAFFGVLDPLTLTFRYASAGHLPPVHVNEDGECRYLEIDGTPLGVVDNLLARTFTEELAPGGALVLFTDGVVEDQRDLLRGERALFDMISAWAKAGFGARAAQIQSALRIGDHRDDAAMFILRFPHVDDFEIRLPATPYNAQRLRHAARRFASGSPFEEDRASDVVLAVGEAVNNAIKHAYAGSEGYVTLLLKRESDVMIAEIRDEGVWREPEIYDRMHGLGIIEKIVDKLEIKKSEAGTVVRMHVAYTSRRVRELVS